jgi:Bacterial TSP3 repeat
MRKRFVAQNPGGVIAVAVFAVIACFVFLVMHALRGNSAAPFSANSNGSGSSAHLAVATQPNTSNTDTDGDALQDWEETLWNTDPHNTDTDGDGVSDGSEVAQGSNPTIFGKDQRPVSDLAQSTTTALARTTTESVARSLMTSAMLDLKDKDPGNDPVTRNKMVSDAIRVAADSYTPPTFDSKEVVVIPVTKESSREYARAVSTLIDKMVSENPDERATLATLAQGDTSAARTLGKIAANYYTSIEDFKQIPVPQDAVSIHVDIVNALLQYAYIFESVGAMQEDPMRATVALNNFLLVDQKFQLAFVRFEIYFVSQIEESASSTASTAPSM